MIGGAAMTTKTTNFDVAKYLVDGETMAMFLSECLEEGGVELFLDAIGEVARAKGMTEVAAGAGLTRASLYKALGEHGNPTLKTVSRVLASLGFRMVIEPVEPGHRATAKPKRAAAKRAPTSTRQAPR
jgi:probable addiction module antidote protein